MFNPAYCRLTAQPGRPFPTTASHKTSTGFPSLACPRAWLCLPRRAFPRSVAKRALQGLARPIARTRVCIQQEPAGLSKVCS